jgi:hypothetical protein
MFLAHSRHDTRIHCDETARRPRTRVRSWKGRCAMSLLTDSAIPTFVTAGTRRTRVSEMRSLARARRRAFAMVGPAPTHSERRSEAGIVSWNTRRR